MGEVGSPGTSSPDLSGERRQVSVLFADMVGFTPIAERLSEDDTFAFVRMTYDKLAGVVRKHGGSVRGFAGDSIMGVFGIPDAQEDAALRACRAALSIHAAFAESADDLERRFGARPMMRAGVSSGAVVMARVEDDGPEQTAVGNTVILASRIQNLAPAGGCLICENTQRQVEWYADTAFHGEHPIKGRSAPHKLWRLTAVREGATRFDASLGRGLSPCLGREREMSVLDEAFQRCGASLEVVDLVAEPGQGKTRLSFEFTQRLQPGEALILQGHCSADGQGAPFLPFLEVVRGAFRIATDDTPAEIEAKLEAGLRQLLMYTPENLGLLLNLLGLKPPAGAFAGLDGVLIGLRTRDLLPALLEARCADTKVVLRLEDIHWIDGASEGLIANLVGRRAPPNLLVVHTRRPEYQPEWLGKPGVTTLDLPPLTADDIKALVQARLGGATLPQALIEQVTERAEGNPLFGEELLNFLIERDAVRVASGKADFDAAIMEGGIPESLQSLLSARVDRLPREDRLLLQAAAAIGRTFDTALLSDVVEPAGDLDAALQRLRAQDILELPKNSPDYVFKHVLVRDTLYQSLLAGRRTELHLKIARALEKRSEGRRVEVAEALAYHYARTARNDMAFAYLVMAGAKSLQVYSLDEASTYLEDALALYERDPACASDSQLAEAIAQFVLCANLSLRVKDIIGVTGRFRTALARCGDTLPNARILHHTIAGLIWSARFREAQQVRQELSAMAQRLGDPMAMAYALVSELAVSTYCAPEALETFQAKQRETDSVLAQVDDAYLRNFYLAISAWDEMNRGRIPQARAAVERLNAAGEAMSDPRSLGYAIAMQALLAILSDNYEAAIQFADLGIRTARAPFERVIASSARAIASVLIKESGSLENVERYIAHCRENGWTLFLTGPDNLIGVGLAMNGRIGAGIRRIEEAIARSEQEGYRASADWCRMFLCEIYLGILSGEGDASPAVLLRNAGAISKVLAFGPKRIVSLLSQVRSNPQFDREGHYIGRAEMILGLLYKAKKKKALALQHLTEAQRIVRAFGPSPMLARIDTALGELNGARG
ncbi:MAG: adenylate/guanylate cyclase domain-containing protein [Beijerinckiaceae bacterium]